MPALLGLLALALGVLIWLGVWQLQRNEWKQDLVARSHARTDAPPLTVTDGSAHQPDEVEYRRVAIDGEWLMDDVMFLANRVRSGVRGEEIVVPVQPAEGPAVLVNMGWIPDGARDEVIADLSAAADSPVQGLGVDGSGRDGRQIPSGSWTALAPEDMSTALGYESAEWFVLAGEERTGPASPSEPLPVQGWQRFENTTPHIEYALTWFGIAAALVAIAVARLVVAPRRARKHPDTSTGRAGG